MLFSHGASGEELCLRAFFPCSSRQAKKVEAIASHTFGMAGKCGPIFNEGEDEEDEEVDSPVIIFEIY